MLKMVDDAVLAARQLELLLYGDIFQRIPVYLYTDLESMLESVASTKQISTKTLRNGITDIKKRLVEGEITSYAWLPTPNMSADILTKEKKILLDLEKVFINNQMKLRDTSVNKVMAFNQEVRMTNICNRSLAVYSVILRCKKGFNIVLLHPAV